MKFLTIVGLLLVLLNVTAYLWPDKSKYAPNVQSEKQDLNAQYLRLNKEIEDDYYERLDNQSAELSNIELTAQRILPDSSCYRVGPFIDDVNFDQAQIVLNDARVEFDASRRESKESNVFRVYIGPYESQAEAVDARSDLRTKGILDHFIRENAEGQPIVSLGIYTTQKTLDEALVLFSGALVDVKFDEELVLLPESSWLHFSLEEQNQNREKLLQVDWGELAAKMGKFACQP